MQTNQVRDVEIITFPAIKQRLAQRWPPPSGASSVLNRTVQAVIQAVGKLDDATAVAQRDTSLSPAGRAARVKPLRDVAERQVGDAKSRLAAERERIDSARAKLFAPPSLAPADAAGAVTDAEIRGRLQTTDEAASAIKAAGGGADRLIAALLSFT